MKIYEIHILWQHRALALHLQMSLCFQLLPSTLAKAIKSNYARLIDGIKDHLTNLVPLLYQEDLVGEETRERAKVLALTSTQKATEVVDSLQAKIGNEPAQFHTLIRVLRSNPALCYLADILERVETQQSESGTCTNY